jgi:hypothetical protein
VVIGFFTLARSRLEKYGLPAIPALAVVLAVYWNDHDQRNRATAAEVLPAASIVAVGLVLAAVAFLLPAGSDWIARLVECLDGHYREHPEDTLLLLPQATALARPFSLFLLLFGASMLWSVFARRGRLTFALWVGLGITLLLFIDHAGRFLAPDRSMREVAVIIEKQWQPDAAVVVAGQYEHAMSLAYYVQRPIAIVDGQSSDLAFGLRQGDAPELVLTEAQLLQAWTSSRRIFLLADRKGLPPGAAVLLRRPTYVLATNHDPQ